MKLAVRLSVFLITICMIVPLAACGGGKETSGPAATTAAVADTTTAEATEPPLSDDLPEMDFKGASFTIINSTTASGQHYITTILELTGEQLNDAMYERTKAIEEKYNIAFTEDVIGSSADVAVTMITNSITAGDGAYDVTMPLERRAFVITGNGYFIDQDEMPNMNLDKPYWFKDVNETVNFSAHTYLTYGSANLGFYDFMHAVLFNKNMVKDLKLENPYELVLDGKWTIDKFAEMGKAAVADADGDGTWGKGDTYAFHGADATTVMDFLASTYTRTIETDGRDTARIMLTENPKVYEVYDKVRSIFWDNGFWTRTTLGSNTYWQTETYFQSGQALFADHTLVTLTYLREMEDDFGVIPFPKWNEEQEKYGTMVEAGTRVFAIPSDVKNKEMSGAVLETLNFLTYRDVIPVFYDITLKSKYSRDAESADMLDIITQNICYDLGATMLNDSIKDGLFRPLLRANSTDYASSVAAKLPTIQSTIDAAKNS